jgi:hypothetical protein
VGLAKGRRAALGQGRLNSAEAVRAAFGEGWLDRAESFSVAPSEERLDRATKSRRAALGQGWLNRAESFSVAPGEERLNRAKSTRCAGLDVAKVGSGDWGCKSAGSEEEDQGGLEEAGHVMRRVGLGGGRVANTGKTTSLIPRCGEERFNIGRRSGGYAAYASCLQSDGPI